MALTLTKADSGIMGDKRYWFGTFAFDSSYPTGGEALAVSDINEGWKSIEHVVVGTGEDAMYRVAWDDSAAKFLVFLEASGGDGAEDEVGNGVDLSTIGDVPLMCYGY